MYQQHPRMVPKHQCRCGVLFRSIQAIKRFKNRVVAAKRSIFGTGFPSFSSHYQFEQLAVVDDPQDVDGMLIESLTFEDSDFMDLEELDSKPASPPTATLMEEEESTSDCTQGLQNQTTLSSSSSSDLVEYNNSSPTSKFSFSVLETLELSEVNNLLPEVSFPDIFDEPISEGVMSTTTLATRSYNYYTSEVAPRVTMVQHKATTAYYGMGSSNSETGSAQSYDLMNQMLMRDGGFKINAPQIIPPSLRRWCILKLIVWACNSLRFSRLTLLSVRGPHQRLVAVTCEQGLKRKLEEITEGGHEKYEGVRSRKKKSGKMWVTEIRMTTKTNGPDGGKVWLGSYYTPEEAARAYDVGKIFGSKAARSFNFPESKTIFAPYKDMMNKLSINDKKASIQAVAKEYGEKGSINASYYSFFRK